MKPKRIKINNVGGVSYLTTGKIHHVKYWDDHKPKIKDDKGDLITLHNDEWEPVQDFQHGDPVWAWDAFHESYKRKAVYVGEYPNKDEAHVVLVEGKGITVFEFVQHRKPVQKTMTEIAEKFGTTVDNFEIVEE